MVAGVSDTLSSVAAAYNDNDATQHKSHTASVCTDGSSHTIEAHLVVEVEAHRVQLYQHYQPSEELR